VPHLEHLSKIFAAMSRQDLEGCCLRVLEEKLEGHSSSIGSGISGGFGGGI
jgi:hypothetical protein